MTDPLKIRVICRDIFRGEKKPGVPFLCLHFMGNVSAFVPARYISNFDGISVGDVVLCDVYDFQVEGIKFIPRAYMSKVVYYSCNTYSTDAAGGCSGDDSESEG